EANGTVHRGADLVAHCRQDHRLGLAGALQLGVGALQLNIGLLQRRLRLHARRDVATATLELAEAPRLRVADGAVERLAPDVRAIGAPDAIDRRAAVLPLVQALHGRADDRRIVGMDVRSGRGPQQYLG